MESRHLLAYGLIAIVLIGALFTIVTFWRRGQIAREVANGRDWRGGSKRWPWYRS